jgi:hypothetical protein
MGLDEALNIKSNISNALAGVTGIIPTSFADHTNDVTQIITAINAFSFMQDSITSPNQFGSTIYPNIFSISSLNSIKSVLSTEESELENLLTHSASLVVLGSVVSVYC